ncbi:hypothetical protein Tco_1167462, partial [Tanacetum coccineum]
MPPEDEVLPAEEHPLPSAVSPTADSSGYVPESDPESDPEEDPEEDDDEDPAEPPPEYQVTARISIRGEPPTSFWSDTEVARLL